MRKLLSTVALLALFSLSGTVQAQIIYDNGAAFPGTLQYGIVTNPGGGFNGADRSSLTAPDNILGFGFTGGNRLADDFVIPIGQTWTITGLRMFGYTTGATVPATTAAILRFLDGAPNAGGNVLAGDTTTNVLTSAVFSNIYRTGAATPLDSTRRLVDNTLTLTNPLVLGPGTYWAEWGTTGLNFAPPITVPGQAIATGNALQFQSAGSLYVSLTDTTSLLPKGMPFLLLGTISAVPEPTTVGLIVLATLAGGGYGYKRWRRQKQSADMTISRRRKW